MRLIGRRSVASGLRGVLGVVNVFVAIGALATAAAFLGALVAPDFAAGLRDGLFDPGQTPLLAPVDSLLAILASGILACGLTWLIIDRLRAVFGTVNDGLAFDVGNVARLRTIGWCLAGLQLVGLILMLLAPHEEEVRFDVDLGAWLGVLIVFMLAEVFRQGADMHDENLTTV